MAAGIPGFDQAEQGQRGIGNLAPILDLIGQVMGRIRSQNDPNTIASQNALNQFAQQQVSGQYRPTQYAQQAARGVVDYAGGALNSLGASYGGLGTSFQPPAQPQGFRLAPESSIPAPQIGNFNRETGQYDQPFELRPQQQGFIGRVLTEQPVRNWLRSLLDGKEDKGKQIPGIPSYAVGTTSVPQTGLAQVHQGEAIVPREQNPMAQPPGQPGAPMKPLPAPQKGGFLPAPTPPPQQQAGFGLTRSDGTQAGSATPLNAAQAGRTPPQQQAGFGQSAQAPMMAPDAAWLQSAQNGGQLEANMASWQATLSNPNAPPMLKQQAQMSLQAAQQFQGQQPQQQAGGGGPMVNVNQSPLQQQQAPQAGLNPAAQQAIMAQQSDLIAQQQLGAQRQLREQMGAGMDSGLAQRLQFENMLNAGNTRTQAQRDLSIAAEDRRFNDQMAAANFGLNQQLGLGGLQLNRDNSLFEQQMGAAGLRQQGQALALQGELGRGNLGVAQGQLNLADRAQQQGYGLALNDQMFGQGMQRDIFGLQQRDQALQEQLGMRGMNLSELQNAQQYGLNTRGMGLQEALGQSQMGNTAWQQQFANMQNQQQFGLQQQQQQLAQMLGMGQLGLQQRDLDFQQNQGFNETQRQFNLQQQLAQTLGLGQLGLAQRDQNFQQGQAFNETQRQFNVQQDLARQLGLGQLGLGQRQQDFAEGAQFDLQRELATRGLNLEEELGRGRLGLDTTNSYYGQMNNLLGTILGGGQQDAAAGQQGLENLLAALGLSAGNAMQGATA
jgi:hypothetical protein